MLWMWSTVRSLEPQLQTTQKRSVLLGGAPLLRPARKSAKSCYGHNNSLLLLFLPRWKPKTPSVRVSSMERKSFFYDQCQSFVWFLWRRCSNNTWTNVSFGKWFWMMQIQRRKKEATQQIVHPNSPLFYFVKVFCTHDRIRHLSSFRSENY